MAIVAGEAGDLDLVATAASAEEGLDAAAQHKPDVAIVESRLPGMSGIAAIRRLSTVSPRTTALVYSAYGDRRVLTDAIRAGARGYVMKSSPVSDLLRALRAVGEGGAYVDPVLAPTLLMDPSAPEAPLTEREREILHLMAEGLRTDEVARRMGVSAETVKTDTRRAIYRLEATGRVHAVANALRRSYIT